MPCKLGPLGDLFTVKLVLWFMIVAFAGACGLAFFIDWVGKLDQDASKLPAWRRAFRKVAVPGWDDTSEEARLRSERNTIRLEAARHNQLITAISVSSQIGRGRP